MSTHTAIRTEAIKTRLVAAQVPTIKPTGTQVRVRVRWTASTPLDLHQADGGLLVRHPHILGDGTAGTVVEVGSDVTKLQIGDDVFGFTWRSQLEKAHQEFCTADEWLFGKLPDGFTFMEAITIPNNFVTVFHAFTTDLDIETPWPKPDGYTPSNAQTSILIWGGASSVGQLAIQILKYYGYTNVMTTASRKHHDKLTALGAKSVFDYKDADVVSQVLAATGPAGVDLTLDTIGSMDGSIDPIAKIAKARAKVAVLLPVIVQDSSETQDPIYEMDVGKAATWAEGVTVKGVRTHFYPDNEFFKQHLQPDIMPALLVQGVVTPQKQKIIEGATLLDRAQSALDALRRKEASMERLIWRISEV